MKIAIDARLYGLENAGLGRYTLNLVAQLKEIDHENEYIVLLRKKYFDLLKWPDNFTPVLADFRHYSINEQWSLLRTLNRLAPDLTHFPHFNVPLLYKKPFIVTIHDLIMHTYKGKDATTLPFYKYGFKRIGYSASFKKAVNGSRQIIVPSSFVKEELGKFYKINQKKITVIYEGVDLKIITPTTRASVLEKYGINNPYFIYTGNAYPHKNLVRAIEAIVELNRHYSTPICLAIASSRDIFNQRLSNLLEKLGAKNFVYLLGFVPDKDISVLYKKSLGFLYPSLYEGFGLPGLEAMASNTLVLASDIPVFKEVYQKHAIYFNPHDYTSMYTAMKRVIEMPTEKRFQLQKSGLNFVKRYSWTTMASETLQVYQSSV